MDRMDEEEMVEILTEMARFSNNAAARIAAIKELRRINADLPPSDSFADLDVEDDLAKRRNYKRKASA